VQAALVVPCGTDGWDRLALPSGEAAACTGAASTPAGPTAAATTGIALNARFTNVRLELRTLGALSYRSLAAS
jgi:hypothetical protein